MTKREQPCRAPEPASLRLVAGTVELYDAEIAGDHAELARLLSVGPVAEWPPVGGDHDDQAVRLFRKTLVSQPALAGWLAYYVCVGTELVGSAGYMGPPVDGTAEIGYSICRYRRRRGFATGAVRALIDRARIAGVNRLRAYTEPSNAASILVLERCGFSRGASDRDGYLRFARSIVEPEAAPA